MFFPHHQLLQLAMEEEEQREEGEVVTKGKTVTNQSIKKGTKWLMFPLFFGW